LIYEVLKAIHVHLFDLYIQSFSCLSVFSLKSKIRVITEALRIQHI